ncbi:MAG: hypothetical protein RDU20_06130 [Desulfomonilaceae bacterium]|nr:hypothetical protein [Desulfomonilaceae bacterium]
MRPQKDKKKLGIIPIILSILAAAGLLVELFHPASRDASLGEIYAKVLWPLLRLLFFLGIGLLVGQILEATGWTSKLGQWVRPLTRWAHLRAESGAAFVASFVSGIVANTLLMGFHTDHKLSRKELILTYLLNSGLPLYLVHLPTTFFIVASLAGRAGIDYVCIGFAAAFVRSVSMLIYCRLALPPPPRSETGSDVQPARKNAHVLSGIRKTFQGRFTRLALYTAPIYVLVFLLNDWGLFIWLRKATSGWISGEMFPVEAAGVVIFALAAEFSSGMAAAGALVEAGALTVKQTVIALVLGSIVASPIRAVRHQLPTHAGIFSLGLGSQLLLLSQVIRIITLAAVTVVYIWWT